MGRKAGKPGKSPNRKVIGSKLVGEKSWETGKIPQPEAIEKQDGWGEKLGNRENPPTGSYREASWLGGKVGKLGKSPNRKP